MAELNLTDEALMTAAARGDRRSFEIIYDRYAARMYHYFLKMLKRDEEMAKDQTQELFLKLVKYGKSFDGSRPFKTWIFSLAHNMCKNIYRHNEVKRKAENELTLKSHIDKSDESRHDLRAFRVALNEEIYKLEPEKRNIFILRFKLQMSIKEIAAITELAEGTVKSRIFYTLKKLSTTLEIYNPRS